MDSNETITICSGTRDSYRLISSTSKWFDDGQYVVIKDDGRCLSIKKCWMEIPKNAKKIMRLVNSVYFHYVGELPLGSFDFDKQERTHDEVRIYYTESRQGC